ncbi:hypothetical protein [Mycobacteroides abscessus]|jgi:hypothetical protein|uniref:hypothetical protein n=1 Tax=Mycobacteroides abscessus TaxID=36809 RepID=UPI0005DE5B45|nr:hypothetical protein [Mycobacteroides abscessus]CPW82974.1 Uncharacterised protein [Mycobacteroides abscessus]SHZ79313.1 Uncharacterised protein [Mycobacteroides abscessus subsp. abscessus]
MSEHVIPIAPGIFIDEHPVVAIVYDTAKDAIDTTVLLLNESGYIIPHSGRGIRDCVGDWARR